MSAGCARGLAATALTVGFPLALPAGAAMDLRGEALYRKAGCIACHESGGKGSTVAPMLPGHTVEQVRRYVRRPVGKMPRFGPDKLTDTELDAIAAYIASLPMPDMMADAGGLRDPVEMHLWMTYRSLSDGDAGHAVHHVAHATEIAADASERQELEGVANLVQLKKNRAAAQRILEMATAKTAPELTAGQMHLRLALGALEAGDVPEVEHHLRHYMENAAAHGRRHAQGVMTILRRGDLVGARKRLAHIMAR